MNKWKMWSKWKKVGKWVLPFIIIAILIAMFWPSSKALKTLPESFKVVSETAITNLGTDASSIKMRIGNNNVGYVYCAEGGRGQVGITVDLNNPVIINDAIVKNIVSNGFLGNAFSGWSESDSYAATQLAIWWYYHEDGDTSRTSKLVEEVEAGNYSSGYEHIVAKAQELMNSSINSAINVDDGVNKTLQINGNYIESDLITVTISGASSYTVSLDNSNFSIVDANGNEKTSFVSGEQFKIRIPKEKVTSNTSVNLTINTTVTSYTPYLYTPDPLKVCNDGTSTNTSCGSVGEFYYRQRLIAVSEDEDPLQKSLVFNYTLPTAQITISKIDKDTNQMLKGANLKLVDSNNTEIANWITETTVKTLTLNPGTYTLSEVDAPDGYIKSQEEIEFTVNEDGSTSLSEIIMYNVPLRKITIYKKDSQTDENIEGAKLKLVDSNNNVIGEWISSTTPHELNVIPGTYTLTEVTAPEWYVKSEEKIEFTVNEDGTTNPSNIVIKNKPIKEVIISKKDAVTGNFLAGASLKIVDENNNQVASWISTEVAYSIKLKAGTYKLIETKAPNGYLKKDDELVFTVDNEGNTNPSNIVFDNLPTNVITISKIDSVSGNRIIGAKLRLLDEDDNVIDEWTSEATARTFDLQLGQYTLEEIEAPKWYVKNNEKIKFIVDNNTDSLDIVMENTPFKDIIISKQDAITGKELPGAKLKIIDENDHEVVSWTSTNDPYILKLNPGVYKLIEEYAPEWYVMEKNPIEFTVREDGSIINDQIVMKNTPMKEVIISKQDITTGEELPGAELKLYDANDNLIEEWISSNTPHSFKLIPGEYKLVEVTAPEWYVKSEETIEFIVNEDGSTNLGQIIMQNKPMQPVTITKKDSSSSKNLAGAKLRLKDANNNIIYEWLSEKTSEMIMLKPGKYFLSEEEAPSGYKKTDEIIEFVVNIDGTTNLGEITMTNKYIEVPKTAMKIQNIITITCGIFGILGVCLVVLTKKRYNHV